MNRTNASWSDPASPVFGALSTAVAGVLPLIDPSKLNNTQRRTVHAASAVLTGVYAAVIVGGRNRRMMPLKVATGLAATGAALRFADAGDTFDAHLEQKLRQAGSRYPRVWMAVGAAALTFAGHLGDRAAGRTQLFEPMAIDQRERLRSPGAAVCSLVEGLLGATDWLGSDALHAQLHAAREVYWDDGFTSVVHFRVPDDLPRAVPHEQVFPVRGQFTGPDGTPLRLFLQISDGKLDYLGVEPANPEDADYFDDLIDEWPEPSEITYVLDDPDGTTAPLPG
ncbi:hypothetical protein [Arthrobacter subterraneus]|uniref:hypothetical protein n=1 Tax=Arthrobacter subterraneus TaxID=335973 RepID=UPI003817DBE8